MIFIVVLNQPLVSGCLCFQYQIICLSIVVGTVGLRPSPITFTMPSYQEIIQSNVILIPNGRMCYIQTPSKSNNKARSHPKPDLEMFVPPGHFNYFNWNVSRSLDYASWLQWYSTSPYDIVYIQESDWSMINEWISPYCHIIHIVVVRRERISPSTFCRSNCISIILMICWPSTNRSGHPDAASGR